MRKPEIQPLVPLISRRLQVLVLLLRCHCIPLTIPVLVPPYIVPLGQEIQPNIPNRHTQQSAIAAFVIRRIVCTVHVGRDDGASLHKHVVAGRRYGARTDRIGVA